MEMKIKLRCCGMKRTAHMWIARSLCRCVRFPSVTTCNADDIEVVAILSTILSWTRGLWVSQLIAPHLRAQNCPVSLKWRVTL